MDYSLNNLGSTFQVVLCSVFSLQITVIPASFRGSKIMPCKLPATHFRIVWTKHPRIPCDVTPLMR